MDFSTRCTVLCLIACNLPTCRGYIVELDKDFRGHFHQNKHGSPWPLPMRWDTTDILMTIDPENFQFNSNVNCDIIQEAIIRYRQILFDRTVVFKSKVYREVESIDIDIKSGECEQFPWEYMDERYDLRVSMESKVFLTARSIWGVLHGMETFSQLVWIDAEQHILINKSRIEDAPRYRHRGIMIDTSSHFIPKPILKTNLDAMAYNKMNVFHWNMIGDESFPYASSGYPELYKEGAYSRKHVYTQSDVQDVVNYARLLGIRVIPHINIISHHRSISLSHPELFLPCLDVSGKQLTTDSLHNPARVMINPTNTDTYSLLVGLLYEVAKLFPDPMIHIGFDNETDICWSESVEIKDAVRENNWVNIFSYYYMKFTSAMWRRMIQTIVWQSPVEKDLAVNRNTTLVQITRPNPRLLNKLKQAKVSVILSWDDFVSDRQSWANIVSENFQPFKGLANDQIIGGEALVWTDRLDGTNLLPKLWPKASALAEVLWSHKAGDVREVMFRLDEQRCRLVRRHIPATPLFPGHCGEREYDGTVTNRSNQTRRLSASVLYIFFICLLDALKNLMEPTPVASEPT